MTYPLSPYAGPIGSFPFPVPPPTSDVGGCGSLTVSFPSKWLPYILGALTQLTLQSTWQGTPEEQGAAQEEAWALIAQIQAAECPDQIQPVENTCGDDDMSCCFRIQDGKLQQFCCGEWQTIADLSSLSTGQPGPQPDIPKPGGGQAQTCYTLQGPGTGFLPWQVSTGDLLLVQNWTGAVNDQSDIHWRGPSGLEFVLNNYVPFTNVTDGSDKLPTAPHLGLIISFDAGATWHDLWNNPGLTEPQPYTVPSGVSNVQPVIAINQHPGNQVAGSYGFCVQVTNNSPVTWEHVFDFVASQSGWVPYSPVFSGTPGTYTPGIGWVNADYQQTSVHHTRGMQISSPHPTTAGTITRVRMVFDMTRGSYGFGTTDCEVYLQINGTQYACIQESALVNGSGQVLDTGSISESHTNIDFFMWSSDEPTASYSGACRLSKIIVDGTGTDPWL